MTSDGLQSCATPHGHSAGWLPSVTWLEGLPHTALERIVSKLDQPERASLSKVSTTAFRLVHSCATRVHFRDRIPHPEVGRMRDWQAAWIQAGAPWDAIKKLEFGNALPPAAEVSVVLASCKHVEVCELSKSKCYRTRAEAGVPYQVPDSIATTCRILAAARRIKSLEIGFSYPLGDEQLLDLDDCTTLTKLCASVDACGPAGWQALLRMTQLASLTLYHGQGHAPPTGMQVDMRALTALTHLNYDGNRYPESDEEVARMAAAFGGLQLPASLKSLTLRQMPGGELIHMPQLTSLEVTLASVSPAALDALAGACPALHSLKVNVLEMDGALKAHKSLKSLTVMRLCSMPDGAVFAGVFPKLASLVLPCDCLWEGDAHVFAGLQMLQQLDIGRGFWDPVEDWHGPGLLVPSASFQVLAALPKLAKLRLNLETEHLLGLPTLSHLEAVTLVGEPWDWDVTCKLPKQLASSSPPPHLRSGACEFILDPAGATAEPADMVYTAVNVADQACFWLLRAPLLETVAWKVEGHFSTPCADMTDMRLLAIASQPGIKHIDLQGSGGASELSYNLADSVTKPILQRVLRMYAARGLRVTYDGKTVTLEE